MPQPSENTDVLLGYPPPTSVKDASPSPVVTLNPLGADALSAAFPGKAALSDRRATVR